MTIALTRPTLDLFDSWAAAVTEFGGAHVDGAGVARGHPLIMRRAWR